MVSRQNVSGTTNASLRTLSMAVFMGITAITMVSPYVWKMKMQLRPYDSTAQV